MYVCCLEMMCKTQAKQLTSFLQPNRAGEMGAGCPAGAELYSVPVVLLDGICAYTAPSKSQR